MKMIRNGFTLIELIIGIVALAISLTLLSTLIFPQAKRSTEPLFQMRAVELGNTLLNEIMARDFDEQSNRTGGLERCGETSAPACTAPGSLGSDGGESRDRFDDVDDYHNLHISTPNVEDALGEDLTDRYVGYSYTITVCYSDSQGVCAANITDFKRITVTITMPDSTTAAFSSIRGNF